MATTQEQAAGFLGMYSDPKDPLVLLLLKQTHSAKPDT